MENIFHVLCTSPYHSLQTAGVQCGVKSYVGESQMLLSLTLVGRYYAQGDSAVLCRHLHQVLHLPLRVPSVVRMKMEHEEVTAAPSSAEEAALLAALGLASPVSSSSDASILPSPADSPPLASTSDSNTAPSLARAASRFDSAATPLSAQSSSNSPLLDTGTPAPWDDDFVASERGSDESGAQSWQSPGDLLDPGRNGGAEAARDPNAVQGLADGKAGYAWKRGLGGIAAMGVVGDPMGMRGLEGAGGGYEGVPGGNGVDRKAGKGANGVGAPGVVPVTSESRAVSGLRPTWRMVEGVSTISLAFEVARKCEVPRDVVNRAEELYMV
jgi:hypothetical protein